MKAYSFSNVFLLVNGIALTHFADGDDSITVARRNDSASDKVGADGRMAVALHADRSGEITVKLMQTSPGNSYLNKFHAFQEAGPSRFIPVNIMFQDSSRQDMGVGSVGYIKKLPEITRGVGINIQEWVFVVERLDLVLGNPAFVGFATALAEMA